MMKKKKNQIEKLFEKNVSMLIVATHRPLSYQYTMHMIQYVSSLT